MEREARIAEKCVCYVLWGACDGVALARVCEREVRESVCMCACCCSCVCARVSDLPPINIYQLRSFIYSNSNPILYHTRRREREEEEERQWRAERARQRAEAEAAAR